MRLPRIRFTVRRLMILVALVGLVAGVMVEGERRRVRFRDLAEKHQEEAMQYFVLFAGPDSEHQRASMRAWEDKYGPIVAHHAHLMEKYGWASRYPWFPVTSDPPEPAHPAWPPAGPLVPDPTP